MRLFRTICGLSLLSVVGLVGCGYHLAGNPARVPTAISQIHLVSEYPDNRLTTDLKRTLISHGITLSPTAPLYLAVGKVSFSQPLPDNFNAGVTFSTTAMLSAQFTLTTARTVQHELKMATAARLKSKSSTTATKPLPTEETERYGDILSQTLSSSESIYHYANQVDTSSLNPLMRRLLSQRLAQEIYDRLAAYDTIRLVQNALHPKKRHRKYSRAKHKTKDVVHANQRQ